MDAADATALLPPLLAAADLEPDPAREPIRIWARSGVERLRLADGGTVVFKYAEEPFDHEHDALRLAASGALPVPRLIAARTVPGLLGMLLEDLGQPVREAAEQDAAQAAILLHRLPTADAGWLPRVDEAALAQMPGRIAARAARLDLPGSITAAATVIAGHAGRLAEGAGLPPFGFCHSEFHPTSLHIGRSGWRLLDFARAFTGPGLLDLASWHGTVTPPDPHATASLIAAYVKAGGSAQAALPRGGIPAQYWALGWQRVWACDWFAERIEHGWAAKEMRRWTDAISGHLDEAITLFAI
jgi:hypothetical protein